MKCNRNIKLYLTIKPVRGNENTDGERYPELSIKYLIDYDEQSGQLCNGFVMLHGWVYDLRSFLTKYLVKSHYDANIWRETYALNKQQARKMVGDHSKCKVIEL